MFKQFIEDLRTTGGAVITGIYDQRAADQTRDYVRIAEARLSLPLSLTWMGTMEESDETVRGGVVGIHGCKALVEVVR